MIICDSIISKQLVGKSTDYSFFWPKSAELRSAEANLCSFISWKDECLTLKKLLNKKHPDLQIRLQASPLKCFSTPRKLDLQYITITDLPGYCTIDIKWSDTWPWKAHKQQSHLHKSTRLFQGLLCLWWSVINPIWCRFTGSIIKDRCVQKQVQNTDKWYEWWCPPFALQKRLIILIDHIEQVQSGLWSIGSVCVHIDIHINMCRWKEHPLRYVL